MGGKNHQHQVYYTHTRFYVGHRKKIQLKLYDLPNGEKESRFFKNEFDNETEIEELSLLR